MKKLTIAAGIVGLGMAVAASGTTASAAGAGIKVGSLVCDVSGGVGLILGSKKSMRCTYNRASDGRQEHYDGSITKIGIDIGVTTATTIGWAVFAPGKVGAGSLAGQYVGATAEATAGIGAGANVLVGGFNSTITLQPVSIQGQTGLNIAAGVAGLTLHEAQ